jgi:hypothetical protein
MSYDEKQGTNVSQGTDNATTFHATEAPNTKRLDGTETKQEKFRRLFTEYQTGTRNGKWADKEKIRKQDNGAMFDAIAGQLELPHIVRERGQKFLTEVSLREYGHPTRLVVFCLCAQLYNTEANYDYKYHPNRNDENNPNRFIELADDLDLRGNQILSVYNKVGADL